MQRCLVVFVPCIHIGSMRKQRHHNPGSTLPSRLMQRGIAVVVPRIHICAVREQHLRYFFIDPA